MVGHSGLVQNQSTDMGLNTLSVVSTQDSKITNISLYTGRAEITRYFKLDLVEGQNEVTILGLPDMLQQDSVRVEGQGRATIHDVVVSKTPVPSRDDTRFSQSATVRQRKELQSQIESIKESRRALSNYITTLKANEIEVSQLASIFSSHQALAQKFDNDVLDLEKRTLDIDQEAIQEQLATDMRRLPWQVMVNLWADADGEVEVVVKYVVSNADWSASYDIRADTQSNGNNITILYKASITQNTGESWDRAPLTLETVTPTFRMVAPTLYSWIVTVIDSKPVPARAMQMPFQGQPPVIIQQRSRSSSRSRRARSRSRSPRHMHMAPTVVMLEPGQPMMAPLPPIQHQRVALTSKGDVTATFRIPGNITIPSGAQKRNVTITTLSFKVPLQWFSTPKVDSRVYIKAKIKNDSEYTFISGPANVYVDGSFISTTSVPVVRPEATFDCSLGLDNSIRITYHPKETNAGTSGFYKKSKNKAYTQRITVLNTRTTPISDLKIVDTIPISQDERIEINLLEPPLTSSITESIRRGRLSTSDISNLTRGNSKKQKSTGVRVSQGVMAQWDGNDDPEVDQDVVGKNGRVNWNISLGPQETVNLALKYEVSFPENLIVSGL